MKHLRQNTSENQMAESGWPVIIYQVGGIWMACDHISGRGNLDCDHISGRGNLDGL